MVYLRVIQVTGDTIFRINTVLKVKQVVSELRDSNFQANDMNESAI